MYLFIFGLLCHIPHNQLQSKATVQNIRTVYISSPTLNLFLASGVNEILHSIKIEGSYLKL